MRSVAIARPASSTPHEGAGFTNIRVADELLVDLLFSANGETFETVQPFVRELDIEGTPVRVLDIEGLLRTRTDYREIDLLDKRVLTQIRNELQGDRPA